VDSFSCGNPIWLFFSSNTLVEPGLHVLPLFGNVLWFEVLAETASGMVAPGNVGITDACYGIIFLESSGFLIQHDAAGIREERVSAYLF